jgi:hypothetical protein
LNIALTKISGSWQRLTLSGWVIAALLMIAYNGSKLMILLSPPITGHSMEVKLASQKWRQLQDKISQDSKEHLEAIDLDMAFFRKAPNSESVNSEPPDIPVAKVDNVQPTTINLPILSGILHNTDVHGRAFALAIIDGQRLKVNDKIQGFKIHKISGNGVVVARDEQQWFISAPKVPYNRIHGAGVSSDGNNVAIHKSSTD